MADGTASMPGVYVSLDDLLALEYHGRKVSFLPHQPVHSLLSGRFASRMRGRGLNFEEIRDYRPGDDVRSIDWKVTARLQKPHIRVFNEERDRQTLLVVDQRLSMFFGSRRSMKSVTAAEAAAIGAWRVLGAGDRVGAIVFDDRELTEFRPRRSRVDGAADPDGDRGAQPVARRRPRPFCFAIDAEQCAAAGTAARLARCGGHYHQRLRRRR